jgi:hypothetical protein
VFGRLHRAIGCRDPAIGSNQNRNTGGVLRRTVGCCAIGDGRDFVGIAEQVIRKIELVPKRLVGFGEIEADSQNDTV